MEHVVVISVGAEPCVVASPLLQLMLMTTPITDQHAAHRWPRIVRVVESLMDTTAGGRSDDSRLSVHGFPLVVVQN